MDIGNKPVMISLVGFLGNRRIPLATGIYPSETEEAHTDFLSFVCSDPVIKYRMEQSTIVSDRAKGITSAVSKEARPRHHHACSEHLWRNVSGLLNMDRDADRKKVLRNLFYSVIKAPNKTEFQERLLNLVEKAPPQEQMNAERMRHYLQSIVAHHISAGHADDEGVPLYGLTTSNVVEGWHADTKQNLRAMPPYRLFQEALLMGYKILGTVQADVHKCKNEGMAVFRQQHDMWKEANDRAGEYRIMNIHHGVWTVSHRGNSSVPRVVDLQKATCSCTFPQQYGVPCSHMVAALRSHALCLRHLCHKSHLPFEELYRLIKDRIWNQIFFPEHQLDIVQVALGLVFSRTELVIADRAVVQSHQMLHSGRSGLQMTLVAPSHHHRHLLKKEKDRIKKLPASVVEARCTSRAQAHHDLVSFIKKNLVSIYDESAQVSAAEKPRPQPRWSLRSQSDDQDDGDGDGDDYQPPLRLLRMQPDPTVQGRMVTRSQSDQPLLMSQLYRCEDWILNLDSDCWSDHVNANSGDEAAIGIDELAVAVRSSAQPSRALPIRGILNTASVCYMNSALQILGAMYRRHHHSNHPVLCGDEDCVVCRIEDVMVQLTLPVVDAMQNPFVQEGSALNRSIMSKLPQDPNRPISIGNHCAQEFFRLICNLQCQEQASRFPWFQTDLQFLSQTVWKTDNQLPCCCARDALPAEASAQTGMECILLTTPISGPVSFNDLVCRSLISSEPRQETCPCCGSDSTLKSHRLFLKTPRVLCLEMMWSMDQLLPIHITPAESIDFATMPEVTVLDGQNTRYTLFAVVERSFTQFPSGQEVIEHYQALSCGADTGVWTRMNDASVTVLVEAEINEVFNQYKKVLNNKEWQVWRPTLLFFEPAIDGRTSSASSNLRSHSSIPTERIFSDSVQPLSTLPPNLQSSATVWSSSVAVHDDGDDDVVVVDDTSTREQLSKLHQTQQLKRKRHDFWKLNKRDQRAIEGCLEKDDADITHSMRSLRPEQLLSSDVRNKCNGGWRAGFVFLSLCYVCLIHLQPFCTPIQVVETFFFAIRGKARPDTIWVCSSWMQSTTQKEKDSNVIKRIIGPTLISPGGTTSNPSHFIAIDIDVSRREINVMTSGEDGIIIQSTSFSNISVQDK